MDKEMRSGESLESDCDRRLRNISLMREGFESSTPVGYHWNLITMLHNSAILESAEIAQTAGVSESTTIAIPQWKV